MQRNEAESEEGKQRNRRGIASSCLGNAARTVLHELLLLESGMHLLAVRIERAESAVGSSRRRSESSEAFDRIRNSRVRKWTILSRKRGNWRRRTSILWVAKRRGVNERDRGARNAERSGGAAKAERRAKKSSAKRCSYRGIERRADGGAQRSAWREKRGEARR